MSSDENDGNVSKPTKRPLEGLALTKNKRRKAASPDPLIAVGKHFARTMEAVTLPQVVLMEAVKLRVRLNEDPDCVLDSDETRLYNAFQHLIAYQPSIGEDLFKAYEVSGKRLAAVQEEIGVTLQMGGSRARSDDMRGIKIQIVEWIKTNPNIALNPPLLPKQKTGRGFDHPRTGFLLCPAHLNWDDPTVQEGLKSGEIDAYEHIPIFMYEDFKYYSKEPWKGLFKSHLLVKAYKHVFTTPSSAEEGFGKDRATRPGNAQLRGMTAVTPASLAYIAMLVRFSLSNQQTFNRNDMVTHTEKFYTNLIDHLGEPDEAEEVESLMLWWNTRVFPAHTKRAGASSGTNTVLAAIKEARAALKAVTNADPNGQISEGGAGVANATTQQPDGGSAPQSTQSTALPHVTTA
ncbi:hypothetical protein BD410DRAFT_841057 [Rickenella mellea]|uniref:Uncharacterized protein n=1 Tax=Rickenella mellea TaxID=50990 RepID=A0A4Y7Q1Y6_9AGAM|nr:hypothetical protein BD410DRAFT_841057 [Rickenella mellea]